MFSEDQQRQIERKIGQLKELKDGVLTTSEYAERLTQKRIVWIREHLDEMLEKYKGLSPEEQAWRIMFFDHLGVESTRSRMERVSDKKIRTISDSFCPYLEACKKLGLDTKIICKGLGEPGFMEMARLIHPDLRFGRDYSKLRPEHPFCIEYIWRV